MPARYGSRSTSLARKAKTASPLTLAALLAAALVAPAHATPTTTWDLYTNCTQIYGSGSACIGDGSSHVTNGNEYQFTSATAPTLDLQASAYHSGSNTGLGNADFLGEYSGSQFGLGVQNLSAPRHAVDNQSGFDFIVFKLPTGTNFDKLDISLSPFGTTENINATILYGTPTAALGLGSNPSVTAFAGLSISNLLADGFAETTTTNLLHESSIKTVDIVASSPIEYFIVAADLTPSRYETDYFKVNAVTAIDTPTVPEPGTLAVFGIGLAGMWAAGRRSRRVGRALPKRRPESSCAPGGGI